MLNLTGVFKTIDNDEFGYGKVSKNICESISGMTPKSRIEICLNTPPYQFNLKDSYKIGFTTWESTSVPDHWITSLNTVDELWTASRFISDVYSQYTDKPVYIFNHGLDSEYKTVKRKVNKIKTILFIGDELRSNEDLVVQAYKELGIGKTHRLIIKRKRPGKDIKYPGITTIEALYSKKDMIDLMYMSDALIYPTSGEGFGLVGLESIGTGMPIISTTGWSEYKDLITVPIISNLSESKWQNIHPGEMYNPSIKDIKDSIINWIDNYEELIDVAYKNGIESHNQFNWNKVNDKIIKRIKEIDSFTYDSLSYV
jgi:glycosyltransferase involved in cell wall biosynthesis